MPTKLLYLLLALGPLVGTGTAKAQSSPTEETFEQAKLAIWCETVSFIYQDNGADSLDQRLDCNNWSAFRQSLRPNYLQANSFFQAIEKPEIYAGYSTNEAKLSKLVEEISKRLKSSPVRQNSPSRQQSVDSLQAELSQLAQNPVLFTNTDAVQGESAVRQGSPQQATNGPQDAGMEEDAEDGFSWAELVQWLLIALLLAASAGLWIENKKLRREVGIRMERRKQEIAGLSQRNVKRAQPEPQFPKGMSRSEVLQLIRSENSKLQKELQVDNKKEEADNIEHEHDFQSEPVPAQQPESLSPQQETEEAPLQDLSQDKNGEPAIPGIYYDKLPFKGGFHHNQLSKQRHPDSIYSIEVLKQQPNEAEFWVTEDADIQKYAMENGLSFFEEACEYDQVEENPSRVRNLERGRLRKKGHLWQIEKKVKVSFE